jgi:hypothetical protein
MFASNSWSIIAQTTLNTLRGWDDECDLGASAGPHPDGADVEKIPSSIPETVLDDEPAG